LKPPDTDQNGLGDAGFQEVTPEVARRRERLAEQAERNRVLLRASDRARFWFAVRVAGICILGSLIGLVPMAWALHTTDEEMARVAWIAGPVIGQVIIITTLVIAWRKWEQEDW